MTDNPSNYQQLKAENIERLKELAAINRTTQIIKEAKSVEETLRQICMILPPAWQYPQFTAARILFEDKEYASQEFKATKWVQRQRFETIDSKVGYLEIYYLREFPKLDEGPFLLEERHLIENIANMITGYINSLLAKNVMKSKSPGIVTTSAEIVQPVATSRQLLQRFINKTNEDRDIYHDLMPFKVKEILLVANLYDAYSIEKEGRFSEHVLGEYHTLNLTAIPRITGVSGIDEAMDILRTRHFDLIIMMMGADRHTPIGLSSKVKRVYPYIPVFLLLNNNADLALISEDKNALDHIDKVFIWNGESSVFFAMIKHVEDMINVENDTEVGMVRVILLVEDAAKYYSRYLPMLYHIVLEQTKRIIDDVSTDELYKILRLRARPKILMVSTYEEAVSVMERFKDYMLCLITDVKFLRKGVMDEHAGFDLVEYARKQHKDIPIIIQSSDEANSNLAYQLKCTFINKNSETLSQDFRSFITHFLGFGNFIYRNEQGIKIAEAKSLKEFEKLLRTIPDESLLYHAKRDHYSLWLMARGEILAAKILNPHKVTDFESAAKIREYLIDVIGKFRNEQNQGKIIPFEESALTDETNIVSLMDGYLGGKGRGLAFVNTLIYNFDFSKQIPTIKIQAPKTSVIGTEEFEYFMDRNNLRDFVAATTDYDLIKKRFMESRLTDTLVKRMKILLTRITKPIAVRSSGLFEDSLMQPFAGIFETYLLPNCHPDINERLKQALDAIKLVFASIYSPEARGYIEAVHYKIEEEKMAVVIQEVAGRQYDNYFYPHISGVAQSYNFYPYAHMQPDEGFAVTAVGLGKSVVDGEKAYRFSPKYPATEISTPKDQFQNSQVEFYAVDLHKKEINLLEGDTAGLAKLDIYEAEMHGNLKHCASVFDADSQVIIPGITHPGPRIINFANILKYNYIPLAQTIEVVLDVVKEAMGSPVEIEFAVDLTKDRQGRATFYLLQIKPLIGSAMDYNVNIDRIPEDRIMLLAEKSMGNGVIDDVSDVIYVDIDVFDKSDTVQMTYEIEKLNKMFTQENRKYLLIGPGRWGTRDRFIGIPVNWAQISRARVIIETSLEGYPLDASSGSHFFHNVVSMNVGYFSIQPELSKSFIRWDILKNQKVVNQTKYFKHVRFNEPLIVSMDGKKRIAVVTV
ncbi:MAG: pyruvate, phosphate dikinase [Bacteroidales bacterium]|nr:pyruvate, phosphate dikinase [Bacteroidales bacterium]